MADYWHLRKADWLATLPAGRANAVRRQSRTRVYESGQAVFEPNESPRTVFLLEDGLVRVYRAAAHGGEYTVGYVRPGELFGEVPVIADRARESFAEARRRSTVLRIPREVFIEALQSSPAALYHVTRKVGQALSECRSRTEDLVFRDVRGRLAQLFLRLAEGFGKTTEEGVRIALPLTQHELATLVGATRQSVSEVLGELVVADVIQRGRLETVLRDRQALQRLAQLPDD